MYLERNIPSYFRRGAFKRLKMRVNLVFSVKWVHTRCKEKRRERERKGTADSEQVSENEKGRRRGEAKEMSKSILEFREDIAN